MAGYKPIFLALSLCFSGAAAAFAQDASQTPVQEIAVTVDNCSPFSSADGLRTMYLHRAGKVELEMTAPKNVTLDAPAKGNWVRDTSTDRIIVSFGRISSEYELFIYDYGTRCILAHGKRSDADLTQSWYGEITPEEPER